MVWAGGGGCGGEGGGREGGTWSRQQLRRHGPALQDVTTRIQVRVQLLSPILLPWAAHCQGKHHMLLLVTGSEQQCGV
jgi:hypothetical protein